MPDTPSSCAMLDGMSYTRLLCPCFENPVSFVLVHSFRQESFVFEQLTVVEGRCCDSQGLEAYSLQTFLNLRFLLQSNTFYGEIRTLNSRSGTQD